MSKSVNYKINLVSKKSARVQMLSAKQLISYAIDCLSTNDKRLKSEIAQRAQRVVESLSFETYGSALRSIGTSYFGAVNSSSKIIKGEKENFNTYIVYLAASDNAGIELCSYKCKGCALACLVQSGHAKLELGRDIAKRRIAISRIVKSWVAYFNPDFAFELISHEIKRERTKAQRKGINFAARLNGTSDINFDPIIRAFPEVQFYDYTKDPTRKERDNYDLTFSFSVLSKSRIRHYKTAIEKGQNIAFPVIKGDFKRALEIENCYSMDSTDLRFLDSPRARYGILKVKETKSTGEGIKNGFVLSYGALKRAIDQIEN